MMDRIGASSILAVVLVLATAGSGYGWYKAVKQAGANEATIAHLRAQVQDLKNREDKLNQLDARIESLLAQNRAQFATLRGDIMGVLIHDKEAADWGADPVPDPILNRMCQEGLVRPDLCVQHTAPLPDAGGRAAGAGSE